MRAVAEIYNRANIRTSDAAVIVYGVEPQVEDDVHFGTLIATDEGGHHFIREKEKAIILSRFAYCELGWNIGFRNVGVQLVFVERGDSELDIFSAM